MMFFTFVSSGLISVWPAMQQWVWPDLLQSGLILAVALAGIVAQAMVLRAYRLGEASYLAPISYTRLIFAGLLGIVFLRGIPGHGDMDQAQRSSLRCSASIRRAGRACGAPVYQTHPLNGGRDYPRWLGMAEQPFPHR